MTGAGAKNSTNPNDENGHAGGISPQLYDFPVPSGELLRRYFALTVAEVRLAQIIAGGNGLEQAAESLGVRLSTIRSQLAAVFFKTQTRRQAQLVALLSRLAHLHPGDPEELAGATGEGQA